jgi:maltooligosyltrehalose synthase
MLQLRRAHAATFLGGAYRALAVTGPGAASIVAFARDELVVAVPRLARTYVRTGLQLAYGDERISLGRPGAVYRNVLDGRSVTADAGGEVTASSAFGAAPLAVLAPA